MAKFMNTLDVILQLKIAEYAYFLFGYTWFFEICVMPLLQVIIRESLTLVLYQILDSDIVQ